MHRRKHMARAGELLMTFNGEKLLDGFLCVQSQFCGRVEFFFPPFAAEFRVGSAVFFVCLCASERCAFSH